MLTIVPLAAFGDLATGAAAFGTMAVLALQALRSWRQGPAAAELTEAQAANEREVFWKNALAEVRIQLVAAGAEADRANMRVDQVVGQIDALRASKDAMELELRERLRKCEDRVAREQRRADAAAARVGRLEAQLRSRGLTPVD